jgi:glyoxylate carboligase
LNAEGEEQEGRSREAQSRKGALKKKKSMEGINVMHERSYERAKETFGKGLIDVVVRLEQGRQMVS